MRILIFLMLLSGIFFINLPDMQSQDIHFSQYFNAPMNTSAGLTGIFNGDQRFGANYKAQWYSVPVDYLTVSGYYDRNFRKDGENSFFSAGILFNYDKAGVADLALGSFGLSGSYTQGITPGFLITGGISAMVGFRSFKENSELRWDNYWDDGIIDISLPSGENFPSRSNTFFDLGAGLNFRLQEDARTKIDIGGGAFHLTQPNQAYYDNDDAELPIRLTGHAIGSLQLFSVLDLLGQALYQTQGPYEEILFGGGINIHISQKTARQVQLKLGINVRLDDALIPYIGLRYDGFEAGVSYDINTSPFEAATDSRGGPEFSLTYIITKVRPLQETKLCRIF
jgi:type IX secretion system PorP/SprF family membrane protein